MKPILLLFLLLSVAQAQHEPAGLIAVGRGGPDVKQAAPGWNSLELVFAGDLDAVQRGPVGMSFPPMYTAQLTFTIKQVIRGDLKVGQKITLAHTARQEQPPAYPERALCLVGAQTGDHNTLTLVRVEKAEARTVETVTAQCRLPLGWTMAGQQALSPWATVAGIWPKDAGNLGAALVCAKSGRPALLCGGSVELSVKPMPPKKEIQWTNPDGDGDYLITVSNKTDKPLLIPSLLTDGKDILWANSLVILCQDKAYAAPGCRTGLAKLESVTLKPGQSVTGTINPLALTGPEWPQGGYRISFQFCLGEKSVSHSFYYMARHHDKIRNALHEVR
jgi:hypothetical protein